VEKSSHFTLTERDLDLDVCYGPNGLTLFNSGTFRRSYFLVTLISFG
jgi:hypothetical protein